MGQEGVMGGAGTGGGLRSVPPGAHLHHHVSGACKSPAVAGWRVVPFSHLQSRLDGCVLPGERRVGLGGRRDLLLLPVARQPASSGVRGIAASGCRFGMCLSLMGPCPG